MTYEEVLSWICRAQDVQPDGGISAFWSEPSRAWMHPYPEVSGYIIPTLIDAGEIDRARRVSVWLRKKQLVTGAIPMGFWNSGVPEVFDTGMVLRGWIEMQRIEPDPRTEESIEKAVEWLEGRWREKATNFLPTHNVRVLWPLKDIGSDIVDSATDFFLGFLRDGFPAQVEGQQPDTPLSHFVVYYARGLWEVGRTAEASAVMDRLQAEGPIFRARADSGYRPVTEEICPVAVAQAAVLNTKMGSEAAKPQRKYLRSLNGPWASDPPDGEYLPMCQVSWCAKFVADALREDR